MSDIALLQIRYDGKDAERHEIELGALGESLKGVARLIGVAGNFAVTGKVAYQSQTMDVRVMVKETKANCFSVVTVLQFIQQHGILSGAVPTLMMAVITVAIYRASNRKQEEMKHLSENLTRAIELAAQGNSETVARMTSLVETLVDALKPAIRQAVEPVGRTCSTMRIGESAIIDEAMAAAIRSDEPDSYESERDFTVLITELDLENRTAKVRIDDIDSSRRVRAIISDPVIKMKGNPYVQSFVAASPIKMRAKPGMRDGKIVVLHVSDSAA
jgi:hypothetical protein